MKDSQPIPLAFHWEAGVKPQEPGARVEALAARQSTKRLMYGAHLMEEVVERGNMRAALRQVRGHQGSPGVDNRRVDALPEFLKTHGLGIKEQWLQGRYHPPVIKRVEMPKPGSQEKRKLGMPMLFS
jgi:RNA-directed DNA polymerase